jgi:hypothetical protein
MPVELDIGLDQVQARLDALTGALDGHDAGAIIAATEALAASVVPLRDADIAPDSAARARALIGSTLAQLEAAAIRVNILKDWTRQRIDGNRQIRGIAARGPALTYG